MELWLLRSSLFSKENVSLDFLLNYIVLPGETHPSIALLEDLSVISAVTVNTDGIGFILYILYFCVYV